MTNATGVGVSVTDDSFFLGCSKSLPETILYIPYILYLYNINGMIIIQIIILLLVMALGKHVTHGR